MTAPAITRPTLREILRDALEDAYWYRKGEVEGCVSCTRNPAGICGDHQADNDLAAFYEDARKRLQHTPSDPEVLTLCGAEGRVQ